MSTNTVPIKSKQELENSMMAASKEAMQAFKQSISKNNPEKPIGEDLPGVTGVEDGGYTWGEKGHDKVKFDKVDDWPQWGSIEEANNYMRQMNSEFEDAIWTK